MLYINTAALDELGIDWSRTADEIGKALSVLQAGDFDQPIKPYLRYHNPINRIIAMPAYIGKPFHQAGLKWVASFPGNLAQGIQRAHSVTLLNDADTGKPVAMFNTAKISGIRTASVSAAMLRAWYAARKKRMKDSTLNVGLIGFGPIGQLHLQMLTELYGEQVQKVALYDIRDVDRKQIPASIAQKTSIVESWEEAFEDADIVMTCTVSDQRYIDKSPKPGALLLNVSLRDYKQSIVDSKPYIIVDDWEEVCRENTDIEHVHLERGLKKEDTRNMAEVILGDGLHQLPAEAPVWFNPMGMGVFDIAIASYYYQLANRSEDILRLPD